MATLIQSFWSISQAQSISQAKLFTSTIHFHKHNPLHKQNYWSISQAQSNNTSVQKCAPIADSTLQDMCQHTINTQRSNVL